MPYLLIPLHWGSGFQHKNLRGAGVGEDTNIQSIAQAQKKGAHSSFQQYYQWDKVILSQEEKVILICVRNFSVVIHVIDKNKNTSVSYISLNTVVVPSVVLLSLVGEINFYPVSFSKVLA